MKPRTRTETRWVVAYDQGGRAKGLYTGQWLSRKDAIRQHVTDKGLGNGLWISGALTDEQVAQGWAHWRAQGDYVTKATITWEEPAAL